MLSTPPIPLTHVERLLPVVLLNDGVVHVHRAQSFLHRGELVLRLLLVDLFQLLVGNLGEHLGLGTAGDFSQLELLQLPLPVRDPLALLGDLVVKLLPLAIDLDLFRLVLVLPLAQLPQHLRKLL